MNDFETKNSTHLHFSASHSIDIFFLVIFIILIFFGTIGNLFTIIFYSNFYKKQKTFLPCLYIILSIIHLILLYMNSFEFISIKVILISDFACKVFNVFYNNFLFLEPW